MQLMFDELMISFDLLLLQIQFICFYLAAVLSWAELNRVELNWTERTGAEHAVVAIFNLLFEFFFYYSPSLIRWTFKMKSSHIKCTSCGWLNSGGGGDCGDGWCWWYDLVCVRSWLRSSWVYDLTIK